MKALLIVLALATLTACGGSSTEPPTKAQGVRDSDLVEPLADGTFRVVCKDGRVEVVTQEQMSHDAVCIPPQPTPTPQPPPPLTLCGNYDAPLTIPAGTHIVTCDLQFNGKVVIQPGAKLLADDAWNIHFRNDVFAFGTADQPIEFGFSDHSEAQTLTSFIIGGQSPVAYNEDMSYKSGSFLSHVKVGMVADSVVLSNVFATDSSFFSNDDIRLTGFVGRSQVRAVDFYLSDNSYLVHSLVGAATGRNYIFSTSAFIGWNTFNDGRPQDETSLYSQGPTYLLHNSFAGNGGVNSGEGNTVALGNTAKGAPYGMRSSGWPLGGASPSADSVLVGPFPLFRSRQSSPNETSQFPLLIADKGGWRFDLLLTSTPFYMLDGQPYFDSGSPVTGYYPAFSFAKKESYSFRFSVNDPSVSLVSPRFDLQVY